MNSSGPLKMLLVIQSPELLQLITQPLISFKLARCSPLIKTSNIPLEEEERKCRGVDSIIYHRLELKGNDFRELKQRLIPLKLTRGELLRSNGPAKKQSPWGCTSYAKLWNTTCSMFSDATLKTGTKWKWMCALPLCYRAERYIFIISTIFYW